MNPAKVHHFSRIKASLKGNPANVQEFQTFSAKKALALQMIGIKHTNAPKYYLKPIFLWTKQEKSPIL